MSFTTIRSNRLFHDELAVVVSQGRCRYAVRASGAVVGSISTPPAVAVSITGPTPGLF
jgi:hypothetical protein